ncbi:MAG TPA: methyltransferase domain-containing protein [Acidobacteriaceae bacterium]
MVSFFGGKEKAGGAAAANERVPRHSSGWGQLLERMRKEESLRVLDIGPTSSSNINFITALGHSIYLANLVEEAAKREWVIAQEDGGARFDVERFLASHLNFSGRGFDVVLFWDTADYLPEELLGPVIKRIHEVMAPGGQMLAMFHAAPSTAVSRTLKADFCRYHLTDTNKVEVQRVGEYPLLNTYSNRQTEKLLESFKGFHFFLGKDNVREVVVTR